jgi:hypothetical protein
MPKIASLLVHRKHKSALRKLSLNTDDKIIHSTDNTVFDCLPNREFGPSFVEFHRLQRPMNQQKRLESLEQSGHRRPYSKSLERISCIKLGIPAGFVRELP